MSAGQGNKRIMKRRHIFFDLGYTLLYLNREIPFRKLLENRGYRLSLEEIEEGFHLTDKLFMREFPGVLGKPAETFMPWYHARLLHHFHIQLDICEFYSDWKKEIRGPLESWFPYPFVFGVLSELKNRGFRLGVISNWDPSARLILDRHNLTGLFDSIVISSECGCEKPSREIFRKAMEELSAGPEESLYVGDNYYDDFIGSRRAGMDCRIINRFGTRGVEELTDCRIIPDIRALLVPEGDESGLSGTPVSNRFLSER